MSKHLLSIKCPQWFKFFSLLDLLETEIHTLQRLSLTRALKGFFRPLQTCLLENVNQLLPWFSHVGLKNTLSPFLEHSEEHVGVSAVFENILLQDLTPLYVKIMRGKNLLSVYWRKLKLSTYLHTVTRLSSC